MSKPSGGSGKGAAALVVLVLFVCVGGVSLFAKRERLRSTELLRPAYLVQEGTGTVLVYEREEPLGGEPSLRLLALELSSGRRRWAVPLPEDDWRILGHRREVLWLCSRDQQEVWALDLTNGQRRADSARLRREHPELATVSASAHESAVWHDVAMDLATGELSVGIAGRTWRVDSGTFALRPGAPVTAAARTAGPERVEHGVVVSGHRWVIERAGQVNLDGARAPAALLAQSPSLDFEPLVAWVEEPYVLLEGPAGLLLRDCARSGERPFACELLRVDAAGELRWRARLEQLREQSYGAVLAVTPQRILVLGVSLGVGETSWGRRARVVALDPATGNVQWRSEDPPFH